MAAQAFGIDIGGSGIKGALVKVKKGELASERLRIPTPQPSEPEAVADTVAQLLEAFELPSDIPVGVTFPGIVQHSVVRTAVNMHKGWVDTDGAALFTERTGHDVFMVNDGDAAGIAEMAFGAGKDVPGTVLLTTLGTGVGTALFVDGALVPNTELGHLALPSLDGEPARDDAEKWMAESVREAEDLEWEEWARRLQQYYTHLELLFSPDLFIVGGGVSKKHKKYLPLLDLRTPIVPAETRNEAGIIGAAKLAYDAEHDKTAAAKKAKKSKDD